MPSMHDGEYTVVIRSNHLTELKLALDVMRQTMRDLVKIDMIDKEDDSLFSVMVTVREPVPAKNQNTARGNIVRPYAAQLEKKPRYNGPRRSRRARHL